MKILTLLWNQLTMKVFINKGSQRIPEAVPRVAGVAEQGLLQEEVAALLGWTPHHPLLPAAVTQNL